MEAKDFTSFIGKTLVDIQQGLNKEGTITFLFEDDEKTQTGFKILPKGVGRLEMCESTVYGGEESSPKKIKRKKEEVAQTQQQDRGLEAEDSLPGTSI